MNCALDWSRQLINLGRQSPICCEPTPRNITLRLHLLTPPSAQDNIHVSLSSIIQVISSELMSSFVAVLFIDALQRMVRIAQEGEQLHVPEREQQADTLGAAAKSKQEMTDVRTETN